jgi:hypothetical protein
MSIGTNVSIVLLKRQLGFKARVKIQLTTQGYNDLGNNEITYAMLRAKISLHFNPEYLLAS